MIAPQKPERTDAVGILSRELRGWVPKSSTGSHFDFLDGLRGVAILMVVFFHAFYFNPKAPGPVIIIGRLMETGWMGVQIFFVLSGFLISHSFFLRSHRRENPCPRGYAVKRAAKILPPFYLSILVFAFGFFLSTHDPDYFKMGLRWALGIPNILPEQREFNTSYWSLVVEAQFYIVLPLLFLGFRRLQYKFSGLAIFAVLALVPLLCRWLTWRATADKDTIGFLMSRFPCKLDAFAFGVLFAWIFDGGYLAAIPAKKLARLGYFGLALLAFNIVLWACLAHWEDIYAHPTLLAINQASLTLGLAGFLMLFFIHDPNTLASRILCSASLRFVGIISYEWFLFHLPVVRFFGRLIGPTSGNSALFLAKVGFPLLITFVFSSIVYRFFSLPIIRFLRPLGERRSSNASKARKTPIQTEAGGAK